MDVYLNLWGFCFIAQLNYKPFQLLQLIEPVFRIPLVIVQSLTWLCLKNIFKRIQTKVNNEDLQKCCFVFIVLMTGLPTQSSPGSQVILQAFQQLWRGTSRPWHAGGSCIGQDDHHTGKKSQHRENFVEACCPKEEELASTTMSSLEGSADIVLALIKWLDCRNKKHIW